MNGVKDKLNIIEILWATDRKFLDGIKISNIRTPPRTIVGMNYTKPYNLFDEILANPNKYAIVIVHSSIEKDMFERVDKCKRLSNAIFVLESTNRYYESNYTVLQHFDDYTYTLTETEDIENLLIEHKLIPHRP